MKPRVPRTFAAAITRIKRRLDDEQCAALVGRSPSLIRKWTDPDLDAWPSLAQAVLLDAAYVDGGWGDPPILEAYRDALEKISEGPPALPVDIVHATLSLQAAVGDLSEAIANSRSTDSAGGTDITSHERHAIVGLIERLEEKLDTIEDALVDKAPD